jgi:hypothetical protein
MLDVPALSLALAALAVFLKACEGNSLRLALAAGLLAGVAAQTKYTAFLVPVTVLLYAFLFRRLRLALAAIPVAVLVFVSWEAYTAHCYERSHFLYSLSENYTTFVSKAFMTFPAFAYLGGTCPALALIGFGAAGWRPKTLLALAGTYILALAVLGAFPDAVVDFPWQVGTYRDRVRVGDVVFSVLGPIFPLALLAVLGRLCHCSRGRLYLLRNWRRYRIEWFLMFWLLWEIVGYYALSPFPAVRRILGIQVVSTLLISRLACWTCRAPARRLLVRRLVAAGVVLGLSFHLFDYLDAAAEKQAAQDAAALPLEAGKTRWFVGHWGFQYYAELAAMRPVEVGRSVLCQGDLLIVPQRNLNQQPLAVPVLQTELIATITVKDVVPLRTLPGFYGGRLPVNHKEGPRLTVRAYRVLSDFRTTPALARDDKDRD